MGCRLIFCIGLLPAAILMLLPSASCQSKSQPITSQQNATIVSFNGYNETGFMNTSAYYGPYDEVPVDASSTAPKPLVDASLAPPGCNIFKQFGIANYSGPLPCTKPLSSTSVGSNSTGSSDACVDLAGKIVLITGASTGIGRSAANRFAAAGATVIGTSRYPWRYPPPPNWKLLQLDQTSDDSVKQLIDQVAVLHGRIDILYLNAGRQFVGDTANSDLRQMMLTFDTNFWGPVRVMQAALPLMPKQGYARILATSSLQSQEASSRYMPYNAAKWSLMALQENWMSTYSGSDDVTTNIKFITILPGGVNTSLGYTAIYGCPELAKQYGTSVIKGYTAQTLSPRDVAEGAYRLMINPNPPLRNLIMSDEQWATHIPLFCRRYTLPLEDFYVNTPGGPDISRWIDEDASHRRGYNCSSHCGGAQFCGAGEMGSGVSGTHTIGAY
ncbi:g5164 [Coccomyxa elongata]